MWGDMGKLKKGTFKFYICFLTGLIAGMLIGSAILTVIVSYRVDEQYRQITYLENTIQEKDTQLEKLEQSINTQDLILKEIEVSLTFTENKDENIEEEQIDEIDKIDIEKAIKEKYSSILGKEVKNIDPDILIEVIDKRIFKIENREYRLQVHKLILTEILKLSVKVELRQ